MSEKKGKILLIDDSGDVQDLVKMILSNEGYEVISALNGPEGILKAEDVLPDLILLDIMMPDMDGWEVIKILKSNEKTISIPVIIFTCKSELKDKLMGLREGAVDYITKPFDVNYLIEKVAAIISKENKGE